jgi:hypothetical protein
MALPTSLVFAGAALLALFGLVLIVSAFGSARRCRGCGQRNPSGSRFCGRCGQALRGDAERGAPRGDTSDAADPSATTEKE